MDEDEARLKGALWKIGDLDFSEKPCVSEQTCPWWIDVEGFPVPQVVYAEPADDGQAVTPESRQVSFIGALTWLAWQWINGELDVIHSEIWQALSYFNDL